MDLGNSFTQDTLPVSTFEPLPAGEYQVTISKTEVCVSKTDNVSRYMKLELTVVGGKYDKRKVFWNINYGHQKDTVREIGLKSLRNLMEATGLQACSNSDDFLNKQVIANIKVRPADGQYSASNDVGFVKAINYGAGFAPQAQSQAEPQAPTGQKYARPW